MWVDVLACKEPDNDWYDLDCHCSCQEPPYMPPCGHCESCYLGERWEEETPNTTYLELFEEDIE